MSPATEPWARVLALAIGGALGVNARYWLALAIDRAVGSRFPWATFAINVTGSFALGLVGAALLRLPAHHPWRLAVMVGFLGGYTTFSTFAMESRSLWESGSTARAASYAFGSVAAGVLAVTLGLAIGRSLVAPEGPGPAPPDPSANARPNRDP